MSKKKKPVFFVAQALGRRSVAEAMRKAGATVEIHDDHFPPEALDVEWLPVVGKRGWLIIRRQLLWVLPN